MSNRKEYELLFSLKAALGSDFKGTFSAATSTVKSLKDEMSQVNSTMGKVDSYKKAQSAIEQNKTKLQQLTKEHERLQAEMAATENPSESLRNKLARNEQQIEKTTDKIEQQETALESLKNELDKAGVNTDDLTKSNERLQASYDELKDSAKRIQEVSEAQERNKQLLSETQTELAKTVAGYAAVAAAAYKGAIEPAIDFESAFAGVKKTVNATDAELEQLRNGILNMSTELPAAATEIAAVSEAAGQLGIDTKNNLEFTKTMIDLGESTNLEATEAASALAKFANVTGMAQDEFDELGSVIVDLGNNFATTESDIVAMATRLASAGTVTGLSQSQIMAFSTALSSVGIEAEAGGSAASKMLKMIELASAKYNTATNVINSTGYSLEELSKQSKESFAVIAESVGVSTDELSKYMEQTTSLDEFAKVAGLSAEEFQQAYGKDSLKALSLFINGLNDTERNGKSAIEILDDMDIKEVRMSNAILSLATSGDLLTNAVDLANEAWEDNSALVNEANQRYATTESKIDIAKNSFTNLGIAVGDLALPEIQKIAESLTEVMQTVTNWVQNNPETIKQIAKVVATIAGAKVGLLLLKTIFLKLQGSLLKVVSTFVKFSGALKAAKFAESGKKVSEFAKAIGFAGGKLGLYTGIAAGAAIAIGAVVTAIIAYNQAMKAARKAYSDGFIFNNGGAKLKEYTQALKDSTSESLYFARQTNQTDEELKEIQEDIFDARAGVITYGAALRNDATLTAQEAEALKQPFDDLCTALERDFTTRYDAVFEAFKLAATEAKTSLGGDVQEISSILDTFKSKYTGSLNEAQTKANELFNKSISGETLTSADYEELRKEMEYINELSSTDSEALTAYREKAAEIGSMDLGENQSEAIENIKELQTYAEEYLAEIDAAQKNLNKYYDDLRSKAEIMYKYGEITEAEYKGTVNSLNAAQGITNEAYQQDRQAFIDETQNASWLIHGGIDKAKQENIAANANNDGINFSAYWETWANDLQAFWGVNGATTENQTGIDRRIAEKKQAEADAAYADLTAAWANLSVSLNTAAEKSVGIPDEVAAAIKAATKPLDVLGTQEYNGYYRSFTPPGYATGTSRSVSTFLAGENGPEIISNMPGRSVYTANETADIFETYQQIIWLLPALQSAIAGARTTNAPSVAAGATNSSSFNASVEIHSSPVIQVNGDTPGDFERKMQQYNEDLLARVDEHLREIGENAQRNEFN